MGRILRFEPDGRATESREGSGGSTIPGIVREWLTEPGIDELRNLVRGILVKSDAIGLCRVDDDGLCGCTMADPLMCADSEGNLPGRCSGCVPGDLVMCMDCLLWGLDECPSPVKTRPMEIVPDGFCKPVYESDVLDALDDEDDNANFPVDIDPVEDGECWNLPASGGVLVWLRSRYHECRLSIAESYEDAVDLLIESGYMLGEDPFRGDKCWWDLGKRWFATLWVEGRRGGLDPGPFIVSADGPEDITPEAWKTDPDILDFPTYDEAADYLHDMKFDRDQSDGLWKRADGRALRIWSLGECEGTSEI